MIVLSDIKCIGCGADKSQFLIDSNGKRYCPFCGNEIDEKAPSVEALKAIKASCQLRNRFQYSQALNLCKRLLATDPTSPIYNWYALLANYKVTFIDNGNGVQEATFLDTNVQTPIQKSKYYSYLSDRRKKIADKLQQSRMDYKEQALKVIDYDVFISYKKHNINDPTRETKEAKWANQLYHFLDKKGYKVFYDSEVLSRSNVEWEPHIYGALKKAKMLILCGSSIENIEAQWVKNEWKRFLAYKRLDKTKTMCILGLNIDPNKLSDPELKLTQMVNADDGNWLSTLEGRVSDACNKKEEKKVETKRKKIVERLVNINQTYDIEKDDSLNRININLSSPSKRQKAINTFNAVYQASSDSNSICSKELALGFVIRNNLDSIDDLFNMGVFKTISDKAIYSKILTRNDNEDLMNKTISFVYKAILVNYSQKFAPKLFLDVIAYNHSERKDFIRNLFPLVCTNQGSYQIFDKLIPIVDESLDDDIDALLKYASLQLKSQYYDLAAKYSKTIIEHYDKNNIKAQELLFLSLNKAKSYEDCFSFGNVMNTSNPINLTYLRDLLIALGTNNYNCSKCNTKYARLSDGITYTCPNCGHQEIKYDRYYDSISVLDIILNALLNGIPEPNDGTGPNSIRNNQRIESINASYTSMIEKILLFYQPAEKRFRLPVIAKKLHQKQLYTVAIKYYQSSFDIGIIKNAEIYFNLLLCDLESTNIDDMYKSNKLIKDSKFYKDLNDALLPSSEEGKKLRAMVDKQAEALKESKTSKNTNKGVNSKQSRSKAIKKKLTKNRLFTLLLIVAFLAIHAFLDMNNALGILIPSIEQYSKLVLSITSGITLFSLFIGLFRSRIINRGFFGHTYRLILIIYLALLAYITISQYGLI